MRDRPTVVGLSMGLLLVLLLPRPSTPALAEVSGAGAPPASFHVTADAMESKAGGRFLVARGNVRIRRDGWSLYADEVEVDREKETFTAQGSVLFLDRGNQIQGSSLQFNYGTGKGVIHDARGFLLPSTTFSADEVHREDERTYRLVKARYNSCAVCQPPPYAWEVRASEVTIHPDEYLWGTHGTFRVKGVPAMYLPVFRYPLADRQTGFLPPKFGHNSKEGFIYGQEFFWAISDSQDATLGLIYRSLRGLSPTLEYRYMLEDGMGTLNAQYLHDRRDHLPVQSRKFESDRYAVHFTHDQTFTPALRGKANVTVRSDKNFPDEFAVGFGERTTLINSSRAFLNYTLPRHAVSLAGEYFETRAADAPETDDSFFKVPEFTVTSLTQPLWGASPLLFEQESAVVYIDQEDNISAARLDLFPSLALPIPLTSYLTFTPRVALRGTFYSRGAAGIDDDAVNRGLVEAGAELFSRLSRTFPVNGERVQAIRHTIESSIGYLYIPDVTQDDLPQFDSTDFINPQNRFFFSLVNRLFAHVREKDGKDRRLEVFAFTLETSVTPDPKTRTFSDLFLNSLQPEDIKQALKNGRTPIPNRPGFSKATERDFANLVGRMSITPPWPVSLDVSGSLNLETGNFETGNALLTASYKDLASFRLGYSRSSATDDEGVIGQVGLTVLEGTELTYLGRYDVETETFLEHQVGFIYQTCCWALSVIYTNRNTKRPEDPENDIRVNLELLTAPSRR